MSTRISNPTEALELNLFQIEFDRVKYIVTDYLRVRLRKIEKNITYNVANLENMTDAERRYAAKYNTLINKQMSENITDHFPPGPGLRSLVSEEIMKSDVPDLDVFVFAVLNKDFREFNDGLLDTAESCLAKDNSIISQNGAYKMIEACGENTLGREMTKGDVIITKFRTIVLNIEAGEITLLG